MKHLFTLLLALCALFPLCANDGDFQNIRISLQGDYNLKYYPENGDWFFAAKDRDENYVVRLDYFAPADNPYGTFTLSDIDREVSCLRDQTSGLDIDHQLLAGTTFTLTRADDRLRLDATLVCTNSVIYTVTGDMPIEEVITIESTEVLQARLLSEDDDWYIRFKNDEYRVTFDLKNKEGGFVNTWTEADILDPAYNMATRLSDNFVDHFVQFEITATLPEGVTNPERECEITGTAIGETGKTYRLHHKSEPVLKPTRTESVNVKFLTAEWPSSRIPEGCYFKVQENFKPNVTWELGIQGLMGTFTQKEMLPLYTCRKNSRKGEILSLDNGTITITPDGRKQVLKVKAELVMEDAVKYVFDFEAPMTATSEVQYDYSNLEVDESYSEYGITWLRAWDETTKVVLTLGEQAKVPGIYSAADASATFFQVLPGGEMLTVRSLAVLEAKTSYTGPDGALKLDLKFVGEDTRQYTVTAYYTQPEVKEVMELTCTETHLKDIIAKAGIFQVYGYNADSTAYVSIVPSAKQIAGHYTLEDLKAYASYNTVTLIREDGTYNELKYWGADFVVSVEGEQAFLEGTFLAGEYQINMHLQCDIEIAGLTYDTDSDKEIHYTLDDELQLVKYEDRKTVYLILNDQETQDNFSLYVYVDHFDDVTMIPAGTYEVNDSYKAPSVQAGMYYSGEVYPTFCGKLDEDGDLTTTLWYAVDGTLTVSENEGALSFELIGHNSYKRNLHVTYNRAASGIATLRQTQATTTKVLRYGELRILHQGKCYDALGIER